MRWLLLGLVGAAVFIYGRISGDVQLSLLSKGIPVIALLLWLRQAPAGTYRRWICIGLVFSLAGDILLDWPGDLFVFGLGAFLIGHLAYLRAYVSDSRLPALPALLLALIAGGAMFAILASSGLGELLIPVACYATAISLMLWRALSRIGHPDLQPGSTWLAAVGAALFVLSDSLIGIDRFVVSFDAAPYAIILTYWLGQWGIAASAFERTKT
ncbi:membrane protein, YhhN family [Ectopseudomonas oleovorans]|uniref:Membrane protein, YhhN family n=1 Tax=Ectopseudomonas oleovorans TaxID=301 RepID=A0A379K8M2_ECTOL|nr:lysoplasmalogenase [Pseudomonas oleovorans]SUD61057.1 membrane protein, YhhN family [Pseudomonas oleovorans]